MTAPAHPTPSWVHDAVFYALMPDRFARGARPHAGASAPGAVAPWDAGAFAPWDAVDAPRAYRGGDLWGVVERLDVLRALGVNALLLTPVFHASSYHRYKTLDHLRVDPLLGGDAALDALIAGAHARGMRVVLDGVFNHVSVGFPPFQDLLENGERSPWRRWFRVEGWPLQPWDASRPAGYACWAGNRSMPELDHANPAVQAYVLDVILHWLRRGADGWRFDAPERLRDHAFWREVRRRVHALRPDAYLLGEIWGDASPWLDGAQWDGVTHYPLLYALYRFVIGPRLVEEALLPASRGQAPIDAPRFAADLEGLLARDAWPTPLAHLTFLSSLDVARFGSVAGGDRASVELGALLLFTLPGAPCLWAGDEVGMEGGLPPANRAGYAPPERWDEGLRAHHAALAALRHAAPALRRGGYRTLWAEGGLLVFERAAGEDRAVVAVNTGEAPAAAELRLAGAPALAFGAPALESRGDGRWHLGLGARAGAVLRLGPASRATV